MKKSEEKVTRFDYQTLWNIYSQSLIPTFILSKEGTIVEYNDAMAELTGYKHEEVPDLETYFPKIYPDEEYRNKVMEISRKSRSRELKVRREEFNITIKDGRRLWVEYSVYDILHKGNPTDLQVIQGINITERKQLEEKLRESEEKFRSLVETIPECIYSALPTGEILYMSSACESIFGYTAEEFIKDKDLWIRLIDEEDKNDLLQMLENLLTKGKSYIHEFRIRRKDDTIIWIRDHAVAVLDSMGNPIKITGIIYDITERKNAEKVIEESEKRFRELTELLPDMIFETDKDGNITYANKACFDNFGYTKKDFSKGIHIFKIIAPEEKEKAKENFKKAIAGEKLELREYLAQRKDGSVFPIIVHSSTITDDQGHIVGVRGIGIDITERKKTDKFLIESEEKYRTLVSTITDAIMVFDADTKKIIEVNKACEELYGYTRQEFLNLNIFDITAEREQTEISLKKTLEGAFHKIPIRYHKKKDSTIFPVEISASIFMLQGRRVFCGVTRDITSRLQAIEELKNSHEQLHRLTNHFQTAVEEEKSYIAREIHDELGQALTTLKIDLHWLSNKFAENQKLFLKKTKSMTEVIDHTISILQKIPTELRPVILDDLGLLAALDWQAKEFQKRTGITCKLTLNPECNLSNRDLSTTIFRIFQEALTNIARHSQATRAIVRVHRKNDLLVLEIKDNGRGITEEQITNSKSFGLIGMRERLYRWDGEITIKGMQNKGTTIIITIPLNGNGDGHD